MSTIESLLGALDERNIARAVGIPHDEARIRFALASNTVDTFDDFSRIIGKYYNHHFSTCISRAGVSRSEAQGRAKEILEKAYRRQNNGDIVMAFNDASDGTNGGLRSLLDKIAEALKVESVEHYVREVFDRFVTPNSWDDKVEIIRQFIARCGADLSSAIRSEQPERYAHEYRDLIRSYVEGLRRTSSVFRRL